MGTDVDLNLSIIMSKSTLSHSISLDYWALAIVLFPLQLFCGCCTTTSNVLNTQSVFTQYHLANTHVFSQGRPAVVLRLRCLNESATEAGEKGRLNKLDVLHIPHPPAFTCPYTPEKHDGETRVSPASLAPPCAFMSEIKSRWGQERSCNIKKVTLE